MTPKGKNFTTKIASVNKLIDSGMSVFIAMSCTLEESDWLLVYAAAKRMAKGIIDQDSIWSEAAQRIEDYDRRENAGEDVSREIRPRFPGGSDF